MTETKTCPSCGGALESDDELCPRCLLTLGRARATAAAQSESDDSSVRARKRSALSLEEISKRFPELEVLTLIGEGGMGAVYKARQPKIDRLVALKVLGFDPNDQPTFAERFRREARVLARLDHPSVVKLYDFGERDGLFYLVLEFVDGTNLRSLMQQRLLEPAQAMAIVPQMCEALQFAHDEGVVHRDIKPENVLIDSKGRVKIADFGLAKLVGGRADFSLTEVGQAMGTPHYMAPEQLRGSLDVDHRADIYSLGVVFYEMLTGELPRGNFALPSKRVHVDVKLDEIVLKSLELTPERRYQHAIEVKTDVESVGSAPATGTAEPERARGVLIGVSAGRTSTKRESEREKSGVRVFPSRPWHYFVTFLLMWPVVGYAFNGGVGWFVLALMAVAAFFWSLVQREIRDQRELDAALQSESRDVIFARHLIAMLFVVLGFAALTFAHFGLFDEFAVDYHPAPGDPQAMHELETRLLPDLQPRMPTSWWPNANQFSFAPLTLESLDRERPLHQPWLLSLALVWCIAAACMLGARWHDLLAWRGWRAPLRSTGSLFGSLLLVHGACAAFHTLTEDGGGFASVLLSAGQEPLAFRSGSGDDLAQRLRIALVERDYSITAGGEWSIRGMGSSGWPEHLRIFFADPASPFDRWRMTWRGPARNHPHAVFVLAPTVDQQWTMLGCDLGSAHPQSRESREWAEWFENLEAALRG